MQDVTHVLIKYNLQFFANDDGGEKTEEPTAKKIEDSRKEGQVAKSKEISNVGSLIVLFLCLKLFVGYISRKLLGSFNQFWREAGYYANSTFDIVEAGNVLLEMIKYIILTCLPFLIFSFVFAFGLQVAQFKWMVTSKPLKPKFSKLSPLKGMKRLFSKDSIFELLLSLAKITIFCAVCYSVIKDNIGLIYSSYEYSIYNCLAILFDVIMSLGIKICLVYMVIALADYMVKKFKQKKDLRMSKQEVKDEYKNQEGDPKIKAQQKQRMMQASRRRMMQSIPDADVVITNPTHYAVVLKYDNTTGQAPVVVAKGADYLAQKIKEIAKENDVEIVENKPLARMLYSNVDVGNEIPAELYQSVAEVLAYVYRIKNKVS
ncbi:MAG: flagellar biosynthesis protein FlhB [Lachnospiraceae bacterium]|nr:flagellar biosynthesis protein FlhB [Lachnospiraceae bacterium]